MTPAQIGVERLRELLESLGTVSDGDYLSRLANGKRINDACINWLRENGAAMLHQLAERDAEVAKWRGIVDEQRATIGALTMGCEDMGGTTPILRKLGNLEADLAAAERARDEVLSMLREIQAVPVACHRTYTGKPETRWTWIDGPATLGAIDNAKLYGWHIEDAVILPDRIAAYLAANGGPDGT